MNQTTIVIPCFNVANFCRKVIDKALPFADYMIAVDDGSTDGTTDTLSEFASNYSNFHFIKFPVNQGKGAALLKAFRYALDHLDFQSIVTIDGDGQHDPSDIPNLVEKIVQGFDLVIGTRKFENMPFRSKVANTMISFLLKWFYPHAPQDTQSGMRAFNKKMVEEITKQCKGSRYEMEFECLLIALRQGKKIATVSIPTIYIERNRSSQFAVIKDSCRILKTLFSHIWKRKKRFYS